MPGAEAPGYFTLSLRDGPDLPGSRQPRREDSEPSRQGQGIVAGEFIPRVPVPRIHAPDYYPYGTDDELEPAPRRVGSISTFQVSTE